MLAWLLGCCYCWLLAVEPSCSPALHSTGGLPHCATAPPAPLTTPPAVVAALWEKEAIALTKAAPGGPPALAISSKLPRFDDKYTLCIALRWVLRESGWMVRWVGRCCCGLGWMPIGW